MNLYAGIDVGGTTIKSSLLNSEGKILPGPSVETRAEPAEQLRELAVQLAAENSQLRGIGIVVPGLVDENAGVVKYAANVDFQGIPLAQMVTDATGVPALLGHDGRAAGRAEGSLGAAVGIDNYIMMPIGTGISAAICVSDKMHSGSTFCAGEIGHSPVFPGGELCSCGQRGCMEAYASASAIARRYNDKCGTMITAREVEERLGNDEIADRVWQEAVQALALGLTHLTLSVDPELIIIGGGLSGAGDNLLQPLREEMSRCMSWRKPPRVVNAELGDSAGRWGAVLLGIDAAGDPLDTVEVCL